MPAVDYLLYGTLNEEGPLAGLIGMTLGLTGEAFEAPELARVTYEITRHKIPISKAVCLRGEFTRENQADLFSLTTVLKNRGYHLSAVSNGMSYHQWFKNLNWLRVATSEREGKWLGFACNEFWYLGSYNEPQVFPPNEKACIMFYCPHVRNEEKLMRFVEESKHMWRVPPTFESTVEIDVEGEM